MTFISRKVLKQNWASFLRCGSASSHYYAFPDLSALSAACRARFIHNSVAAVRGSTAQWSFKKPLVPTFWLPHWRDTDSSGNRSAAGNWRKRGRERSISYCDIIETVCAIKLAQRRWINKGLVLIFYFLQLKQTNSFYFLFCGPECDFKAGVTSRSSSSTSLYGWWVSGLFTLSRRSTASRQVKLVWATNTCCHKPDESLLWQTNSSSLSQRKDTLLWH